MKTKIRRERLQILVELCKTTGLAGILLVPTPPEREADVCGAKMEAAVRPLLSIAGRGERSEWPEVRVNLLPLSDRSISDLPVSVWMCQNIATLCTDTG